MFLSLLSFALLNVGPPCQTAPAPGSLQTPASIEFPAPMDPQGWITPGAHIPDLELPRVDGSGLVRLKDYEGKKLLLIHFASW